MLQRNIDDKKFQLEERISRIHIGNPKIPHVILLLYQVVVDEETAAMLHFK
jgi:hypothetical protein